MKRSLLRLDPVNQINSQVHCSSTLQLPESQLLPLITTEDGFSCCCRSRIVKCYKSRRQFSFLRKQDIDTNEREEIEVTETSTAIDNTYSGWNGVVVFEVKHIGNGQIN